jgi:regulator of sigma E protease
MREVLGFILAISILVSLHELGHYLAARAFGVRVLRFSVGFGRVVYRYQKQGQGTEWCISAIPLGGYVSMLKDKSEMPPDAREDELFESKPLWQKSIIMVAGSAMNFALAVALFAAGSLFGNTETATQLGIPAAQTAADRAGVEEGDEVVALWRGRDESSERAVLSMQDLRWQLIGAASEQQSEITLVVKRGSSRRELRMELPIAAKQDFDAAWFASIGLRLPDSAPRIASVLKGGAAEASGLQAQDLILRIDGQAIKSADALRRVLAGSPDKPLQVELERAGAAQRVSLTPRANTAADGSRIGLIGAAIGEPPQSVVVQRGLVDSVAYGAEHTYRLSVFTLRMLGKMLLGQASLKQISGPLTIADYAGKSLSIGLASYMLLLGAISVSLGVLNLLPIPLLDGGHLLYYAGQALLGRPIPARLDTLGKALGLVLLVALMALAFFNDLSRYVF